MATEMRKVELELIEAALENVKYLEGEFPGIAKFTNPAWVRLRAAAHAYRNAREPLEPIARLMKWLETYSAVPADRWAAQGGYLASVPLVSANDLRAELARMEKEREL
jgi:hypothetical protein